MRQTATFYKGVIKANSIKRTKDRTITEIILFVSLWRQLFNGVSLDGALVRYSLIDAA